MRVSGGADAEEIVRVGEQSDGRGGSVKGS